MKECPKCGADISDSFQEAEPDVGVNAGWYCDVCDEGYADEDGPEHHDDDVQIFGASSPSESANMSGKCPHCFTPLEMGYGLAGGGFGPYVYCPASNCGKHFVKSQDST